jgi:DNA polymerase III sliding clamp (beta) subunit (PCNA family)
MEKNMSLIDDFKTTCIILEKTRKPDGAGGFLTEWHEGTRFEAAITFNNSMEARTAEKQGVTSLYTVTTAKNAKLEYHDVFKRLSDNKIFRVTSDGDDILTPARANFQFLQVNAEEWSLPT